MMTKQPEWTMEPTEKIAALVGLNPYDTERRRAIAHDISQSPYIKELVEAAELQVQNFKRQNLSPDINNLGDDDHEAWKALVSALLPFKGGD